jgi:hypothetical protein
LFLFAPLCILIASCIDSSCIDLHFTLGPLAAFDTSYLTSQHMQQTF